MSKTEETTPVKSTTKETEAADTKSEKSKFVVASQVKNLIRGRDFCIAADLVEALSQKVEFILNAAILRAEANSRKTVRPCDL